MASGPHTFQIMGVFSPERYKGNPLAVVAVRGNALTPQKKSLIAKEFAYQETIFVHDAPGPGQPRKVEIFTEQGEEVPFAGHPIIGLTHYIFSTCERLPYNGPQDRDTQRQTAVFLTKAGPVPVFYNNYRQVAACAVPHAIHLHKQRLDFEKVLNVQPQLQIVPTINNVRSKTFPVVSSVKGMTFSLIDLTDAPEVLGALRISEAPETELDDDWKPSYVGALYYKRQKSLEQPNEPTINSIQARMISHNTEDPGTGSACCALACYLALGEDIEKQERQEVKETTEDEKLAKATEDVKLEDKKSAPKLDRHVYAINQGVEMGRHCTLAIEVDLKTDENGKKSVSNVTLSGRASYFAKGELF